MSKSSVSADMLHLNLKQLGATQIQSGTSRVSVFKFEINQELTVSYFCYIKDEEKIYLQRIEPYPVRNYRFETVENIVSFISKDVEQFRNASKSSNFNLFLEIIHTNYEVRRELEELFLLHNVAHDELEEALTKEQAVLDNIKNTEHATLQNALGEDLTEGNFRKEMEKIHSQIERGPSSMGASELYGDFGAKSALPSDLKYAINDAIRESLVDFKDEIRDEIKKEIKKNLK